MRFTDNQCNTLETAASLSGLNLTHWVLSNLMDDAKRDILESSTTLVSDEAYGKFVASLDDPMPVNSPGIVKSCDTRDDHAAFAKPLIAVSHDGKTPRSSPSAPYTR